MKTIKEEILRIKSLFGEDKLYGNSITEGCADEKEAKKYLEDKGNYKVFKVDGSTGGCLNKIKNNTWPHLKCLYTLLAADSDYKSHIEVFEQSGAAGCVIHIDQIKGTIKPLKSAGKGTHRISFWQKGTYKGGGNSFAITTVFDTPYTPTDNKVALWKELLGKSLPLLGMEKIQLRGKIDNSCKITDLWINVVIHKESSSSKKAKKIIYDTEWASWKGQDIALFLELT